MSDSDKETDETKFNETLKRMLKTPPKPHDKAVKEKADHGKGDDPD